MDRPIDFDMARLKRDDPRLHNQVTSMNQITTLCENFVWSLVDIGSGGVSASFPIGDKHTATVTVDFKENDANSEKKP